MNSTIERWRRQSASMWASLSVRPGAITPCLTAESCIARSDSANVVSRSPTDPSLKVSPSPATPASVRTRTGCFSAPNDHSLAAPRAIAVIDQDDVVPRSAGDHVGAAAAHVDALRPAPPAPRVTARPGVDQPFARPAVEIVVAAAAAQNVVPL